MEFVYREESGNFNVSESWQAMVRRSKIPYQMFTKCLSNEYLMRSKSFLLALMSLLN